MKLTQTTDYLLLIDEEAEIKENTNTFKEGINGDWYWNSKYNFVSNNGDITAFDFKIIAYYLLTKGTKELDLPLLPNPIRSGNEVIDWIDRRLLDFENMPIYKGDNEYNSIIRIKKKLERQPKQFSLEDMEACFEVGRNFQLTGEDNFNEFIQSLSTQQLPKEFIPEYRYYYQSSKEFYSDAEFVECSKEQYKSIKVEIPTCPLKAEIKTITNSEGKEEIVGAYKYNTKKS